MTEIFLQIKKVILKIIFLFQMRWHELEVHYNETSGTEGENEIDCPISSNNDRRKVATRNTNKNTNKIRINTVNLTQMIKTKWLRS